MKKEISIQKILIAIDENEYSKKALKYGHHLARRLPAKIGLVHVNELPLMPGYVGNMVVGEAPTVVPELMSIEEESTKHLFEKAIEFLGKDIEVHTFSRIGVIRDEILKVADEWKADLLILGTHGRTGFDHFIMGSVAEGVARKAHCPVLIIPNKKH